MFGQHDLPILASNLPPSLLWGADAVQLGARGVTNDHQIVRRFEPC